VIGADDSVVPFATAVIVCVPGAAFAGIVTLSLNEPRPFAVKEARGADPSRTSSPAAFLPNDEPATVMTVPAATLDGFAANEGLAADVIAIGTTRATSRRMIGAVAIQSRALDVGGTGLGARGGSMTRSRGSATRMLRMKTTPTQRDGAGRGRAHTERRVTKATVSSYGSPATCTQVRELCGPASRRVCLCTSAPS
jgi:hypothetical protein